MWLFSEEEEGYLPYLKEFPTKIKCTTPITFQPPIKNPIHLKDAYYENSPSPLAYPPPLQSQKKTKLKKCKYYTFKSAEIKNSFLVPFTNPFRLYLLFQHTDITKDKFTLKAKHIMGFFFTLIGILKHKMCRKS